MPKGTKNNWETFCINFFGVQRQFDPSTTRFVKKAWGIWFHSRTRACLKSATVWGGGPLSMHRWSSSHACSMGAMSGLRAGQGSKGMLLTKLAKISSAVWLSVHLWNIVTRNREEMIFLTKMAVTHTTEPACFLVAFDLHPRVLFISLSEGSSR